MHVIKRLMVIYDNPFKFQLDRFLIFIRVWYHMTFKLRVSHLSQMNYDSYEESTVCGLFI